MATFKYEIKLLGIIDYYGNAVVPKRHLAWLTKNCKGNWQYNSPDAPKPVGYTNPRSKNHPIFFDMIFSFSRKTDFQKFRKKFC